MRFHAEQAVRARGDRVTIKQALINLLANAILYTPELGLAIARWAIELNGGSIELESEERRGSVFRITLEPLTSK